MTLTLGSSDTTLLTTTTNAALATGAGEQFLLLKVTAANTGAGSAFVTVWRVIQGGAPADTNIIATPVEILGKKTAVLPLAGQTLVNGQALYASASVASVVNLSIGYASL